MAFSGRYNFTFFFCFFSYPGRRKGCCSIIIRWVGKDSGMTVRRNDATAYCCERRRKLADGRNELGFRIQEGNAGCVLEEHGKVVGKLLGLTFTYNPTFLLSIWKTARRFITRAKKRAEGWPVAGV